MHALTLAAFSCLLLTYPIEVTLASTGGRMLLTWTGVVQAQSMPPLLGEMVMRSNIEDQFRGMVREIERRDALRREREEESKR